MKRTLFLIVLVFQLLTACVSNRQTEWPAADQSSSYLHLADQQNSLVIEAKARFIASGQEKSDPNAEADKAVADSPDRQEQVNELISSMQLERDMQSILTAHSNNSTAGVNANLRVIADFGFDTATGIAGMHLMLFPKTPAGQVIACADEIDLIKKIDIPKQTQPLAGRDVGLVNLYQTIRRELLGLAKLGKTYAKLIRSGQLAQAGMATSDFGSSRLLMSSFDGRLYLIDSVRKSEQRYIGAIARSKSLNDCRSLHLVVGDLESFKHGHTVGKNQHRKHARKAQQKEFQRQQELRNQQILYQRILNRAHK